MNRLEEIYDSFLNAVEMVIDIPLPEKLRQKNAASDFLTALFIPVAGLIAGVFLAALSLVLKTGPAGSFLWAFAAWVILELTDSGRASLFTAEFAARLIYKKSAAVFVPVSLMQVSVYKLGMLFFVSSSGGSGYMIPFFTAVFSAQMYLAVYAADNPLLKVEEDERKRLWIIPAAVAFVTFWVYPLVVCATIAATAVVLMIFVKKKNKEFRSTGDDITCVAGVIQLLLLFAAAILFSAGVK